MACARTIGSTVPLLRGRFREPDRRLLNGLVTLPGHDQSSYRLRMEWGPTGAAAVPADYAVVVDVLSFTTTLTVALERGIEVFPFRWRDSRAAEHAMRHGATLAVGRFEALSRGDARHVSLSPASLSEVEGIERLVLPSPNGSTIAFALADSGAQVVGACLRNAGAVARWLAPRSPTAPAWSSYLPGSGGTTTPSAPRSRTCGGRCGPRRRWCGAEAEVPVRRPGWPSPPGRRPGCPTTC